MAKKTRDLVKPPKRICVGQMTIVLRAMTGSLRATTPLIILFLTV